MTHNTRHFAVADPRTFDGDPFEVADRAVAQVEALAALTEEAIEPAKLMARNAELERQCQRDEDLDAPGWPDTPEGRRWASIEEGIAMIKRDLGILRRVASFNPRRPPKV